MLKISGSFRNRQLPHLILLFLVFLVIPASSGQMLPEAGPAVPVKSRPGLISLNNTVQFGNRQWGGKGSLAFDSGYAYLGTPNGLFRAPRPLVRDSVFELVNFSGKAIFNVYADGNWLYLLKDSPLVSGPAEERSILRSPDGGVNFIPVDSGLYTCMGKYCQYLIATQAAFRDGLIFSNAGGGVNLLVSNNDGAVWSPLLGGLFGQMCYSQPFEIIGTRVIVGGECPLDIVYLRAGTLRPDLQSWEKPPTDVATPNLGNRNIQFIRHKPGSSDVYAGVEGGLLKSSDLGHSFDFVIKYGLGGNKYPYIRAIHFSSVPNLIVAGGFDKGISGKLYLAYSKDNGLTWYDISDQAQLMVGPPSSETMPEPDEVDFINEDHEGNILVGVRYVRADQIKILRVNLNRMIYR